jgi:hypothetical protein
MLHFGALEYHLDVQVGDFKYITKTKRQPNTIVIRQVCKAIKCLLNKYSGFNVFWSNVK